MPFPWFNQVRDSHKLTIFSTDTVRGGSWGPVFTKAVAEFNRISSAMSLGVRLDTTGATKPDPTAWTKGANIQFDAASGTVHEDTFITPKGVVLSQFTEQVSGTAVHGLTMPPRFQDDKGNVMMFRAYIYVPLTPMFTVGAAGSQTQREVGDGVKLFIAVHEMLHAAGLSGPNDHSQGTDPDIFIPQPQPAPGKTAADDKLQVRFDPRINLPFDPPKDPLFISNRTAGLLRSVW